MVKDDARAEQFNVCMCLCCTFSLLKKKKEGVCLEDMCFEHRGNASFTHSSERADLTE